MRRLSRSYIDTRKRCRRRGYWQYLAPSARGRRGWDQGTPNLDLALGRAHHSGMETLMLGAQEGFTKPIEPEMVADAAIRADGFGDAEALLVRGLILGWIRAKLPAFLEEFEIISVEKEEAAVAISPTHELQVRADVVVRERLTGRIFVFNWKTSNTKTEWSLKWSFDLQTLTEALGVEQALGQPVVGVIYEGFYKGQRRPDGTWTSPLAVGYSKEMKDGTRTYKGEWTAGWTKFSADSFEADGQPGWIKFLPLPLVEEQFPRSAPIFRNDEVAADTLAQIVKFETDADTVLESGSERDALIFFEQSASNWNCARCPFAAVCAGRKPFEALVDQGHLVPRVDHHGEGASDAD